MWRFAAALAALLAAAHATPRSADELVSSVTENCADMGCVKEHVLEYLDNVLGIQSDARSIKNVDGAIYKRVARVLQTREFRMRLPEVLFGNAEAIYNPQNGFDIATYENENESRGLLKKKLLLPFLLLFKLKMKLLMPIFVALIGLKATKALILSKLAILIVLGFVAYQLLGKAGMPLPMMMPPPPEPPAPVYGAPAPAPSPAPPNSYEPGWEPNTGGPYSRVWTGSNDDAQRMAYSAYYPGQSGSASSSTSRP